ncbi:MAG TPA: BON domain-containing protein [Nitrospira sp.]|nr:BON domain-containing protein [Nitrospira sp.]
MFTRTIILGLLFASLSTLFCADVRAQSADDDFDVYDYPHEGDNWSYGIVDACQKDTSRGPMGGTRDWQWKSDEELRLAVKCQIESSPFIKSQGIDVTVHEGTATLRGTVQDQDSIRSAIVDAYGAGVKDVVSQLKVEEE